MGIGKALSASFREETAQNSPAGVSKVPAVIMDLSATRRLGKGLRKTSEQGLGVHHITATPGTLRGNFIMLCLLCLVLRLRQCFLCQGSSQLDAESMQILFGILGSPELGA